MFPVEPATFRMALLQPTRDAELANTVGCLIETFLPTFESKQATYGFLRKRPTQPVPHVTFFIWKRGDGSGIALGGIGILTPCPKP